jgi:predicted phosphoribosyltransferase
MVIFQDRVDAGRQLATAVRTRQFDAPIVLGIPRGGVPVAAEVADALDAPLGVVVARKIGAPDQPELAIGAVASDGSLFLDEELAKLTGADAHYLTTEKARQASEARRREEEFDGHLRPPRRAGPSSSSTMDCHGRDRHRGAEVGARPWPG